jgi:hypothetical protein
MTGRHVLAQFDESMIVYRITDPQRDSSLPSMGFSAVSSA